MKLKTIDFYVNTFKKIVHQGLFHFTLLYFFEAK